jgi:hypothetical protein
LYLSAVDVKLATIRGDIATIGPEQTGLIEQPTTPRAAREDVMMGKLAREES